MGLIVLTITAPSTFGMPAYPKPVELVKSDGTPIVLRIKGTPYFNWFEDLDGYPVVRSGPDYRYATL